MRVRSRTTVIAGLVVLGLTGLIWAVLWLASPREPIFQGKTLSEWIAPFCRQTANGLDEPAGPQHFQELEPARNAARQIGTNGIPFLIARLNHRESRLHREVRQLLEKQPIAGLRLTDPHVSKIRAIRALAILGAAAQPATPSLKAQLADAALSVHAVYALSGMGTEGMRTLVEEYTKLPAGARMQIAMTIVSPASIYRGENDVQWGTEQMQSVVIDGLLLIAQDRSFAFRTAAIHRLGECGPMASNAVPFLVKTLAGPFTSARSSTIWALGQIRSQPELVVPAY
jgi:hypothetical protein